LIKTCFRGYFPGIRDDKTKARAISGTNPSTETLGGDLFAPTASETSRRHSDVDGSFGDMQVADISKEEDTHKVDKAIRIIDYWIDESGLSVAQA
jgi:hypothetical protein